MWGSPWECFTNCHFCICVCVHMLTGIVCCSCGTIHLIFWESFTDLGLLIRLGWLASKAHGPAVSASPVLERQALTTVPSFGVGAGGQVLVLVLKQQLS